MNVNIGRIRINCQHTLGIGKKIKWHKNWNFTSGEKRKRFGIKYLHEAWKKIFIRLQNLSILNKN